MSRLGARWLVAASLLGAWSAGAQDTGQTAFVYLVDTDTVGIERFTAAPHQLTGEVLQRGQPRVTYLATRGGAGSFSTLDLVVYPPNSDPDAAPLQRARLRLVGDTVFADITAAGATRTQRLPSKPNAFILLNSSVAMFDVALERLSGANADSVSFFVLLAGGGQTVPITMRRVTPDSIVARLGPQESHLIVRDGRVVRLRTPTQRLVVERIQGAAVGRLSLGKPDYSAPAGAPYRAEHVKIPTPAGHSIAGTLTLPEDANGRIPAVVTISGSGPQDRDEHLPLVPGYRPFRQVADTLGRRQIAVLRLDDRGTGESAGDFARATSGDFADDVRAAIAWLRSRSEIDPARIALLGHSEGGLIAPLVAASDPRIAAVVLLAGPSKKGRDILDFQFRYAIEHDSAIAPAKRDSAFAAMRAGFDSTAGRQPWMRFFQEHDPLPTIRLVKAPVLILQGATDQQVTPDQAEVLAAELRRAGNGRVKVRVYPDRNHLFLPDPSGNPAGYSQLTSGKIGPEVMGEIADWLVMTLEQSRPR